MGTTDRPGHLTSSMRGAWALFASLATMLAIGLGATASPAGAALGPPPWNAENGLCPASLAAPLGADSGCEWGIDVTEVNSSEEAIRDQISQDADQGPYDGIEDVLVVIENDSSKPLKSIKLGFTGSGQDDFGFDFDGICSGLFLAAPPCPYDSESGATGYEGPDTFFSNYEPESARADTGTVNFRTPLAPGQHTFFSLELSPNTILTDNNVDNFVSTAQTAPGGSPSPYLAVSGGINVTDAASIVGPHGVAELGGDGTAEGTVTYKLFPNNTCTGGPVYQSAPKLVSKGVAEASDPVGASLGAGRYYWLVEYTGDGTMKAPEHDTPSVSLCGNEVLDIGGTTVTTKLSSTSVPPGTGVTDSATVTGATPPGTATGVVTFTVYSDSSCKSAVAGQTQSLALSSATATTAPVVLPPGTYYFQAVYNGDPKNASGASGCGAEVLTVGSPPPPPPPTNPPLERRHPFVFVHTGEIEGEYEILEPGEIVYSAEVAEGAELASVNYGYAFSAKQKKCKKGYKRVGKRCVNNKPVKYGSVKVIATKAGVYKLRIKPSKTILAALKRGKHLNVRLVLVFTPAGTTDHIRSVQFVKVHYTPSKKKHHK